MNIPEFFIKNWQFTICIFLLLSYWGYRSFTEMSKTEDPLFPLPQYNVIVIYPGANPSDIEELVVKPIESALGTLLDIDFTKTNINDGIASIQIKFLQHADEDKKYDEVLREINNLRPDLPSGVASIEVIQASTSNVNILQYAVVSDDHSYKDLGKVSEDVKAAIEKVKGVRKAEVHALPQQQINVYIDIPRLTAKNITIKSIVNALQSEGANIPGGYVDIANNRYSIKTSGGFETLDGIRKTIIKSVNGNVVYLHQVADVSFGEEQLDHFARYNGKKAVFVSASQQENTNIFSVTEEIEKHLEPLLNRDTGIEIIRMFNQSESVQHRLNGLYRDFIIAVLLVLITLLPLGVRASYVVMFTVPTSIFIGITLLYLTGYSLNQFSIVGLVIALGLLVDDSIIVVENIVAKLRKGIPRDVAAVEGTNQLLWAIIGVTACIILSFLPVVTLKGATGDFIRSLPLAVIYTMLGSLFVSVTLTPFVSSKLLNNKIGDNIFYRWVMKLNEGPFLTVLHKCLKYPKTTLLMAAALVVCGLGLLKVIGTSFFPKAEKRQFLINISLPLEANIQAVDSVAQWVERQLEKHEAIHDYAVNIGKGNPQVYYNLPQQPQKVNTAQIFCQLKEYDKDSTPLFLDSLRQCFSTFAGADIQIKEFVQGPPVTDPIEIRITGNNFDTLRSLAEQVELRMKEIPGTEYVSNPLREYKSDLKLQIDHEKALALGVPVSEINQTIRTVFAGNSVAEYTDDEGDNYDVVVSVNETEKRSLDAFNTIYVASGSGKLIPLNQLATIELQTSPSVIQHYNRVRSVTISSAVSSGYLTNNVTNEILEKMQNVRFPAGYGFQAGGELEKRKESFSGLTSALVLAVFAITAVLILEFKGIRGTIIVASAIPLGVFGSIVALALAGYTFSFTAFIGLVTLIGLEVKNTIIIVDFTNQMRAIGLTVDEAIEKAREERFTPIFLTTVTAVFALLPLVLERSDFFSPLALVLIGGLLSSLFLTRFVEPVLYKMLMRAE